MLFNATLLRVDPPSPAPPGEALSSPCTLNAPTENELRWLDAAHLSASAVLYLPLSDEAAVAIGVGDQLSVRLDGQSATAWTVVNVSDRVGGAIRYRQVFLSSP